LICYNDNVGENCFFRGQLRQGNTLTSYSHNFTIILRKDGQYEWPNNLAARILEDPCQNKNNYVPAKATYTEVNELFER
jgi:hypothetical protein